jgi:hypothetical protein
MLCGDDIRGMEKLCMQPLNISDGENMRNPEKRYAAISAIISILAVGLIFLPGWVGMDGMNGGYAISLVSILMAVSAAVITGFFWQRAVTLDNILTGKDLLAHWSYQPEEWQSYTRVELREQTNQNKWLLIIMAAWAILFGGLFWVLDRSAGGIVFLVMLGLILILTMAAFGIPRWRYWHQQRDPGEAWIAPKAIYFDGALVCWAFWGTRLENVVWCESEGKTPALIEFKVSSPSRTGRQSQTIRIPIPDGREIEARNILQRFRQ